MSRSHPESISPTAHYTGYVWVANGHSDEAFATGAGRLMYRVLRGPNAAAHAIGLPSLDGMLLARHRLIDLRLHRAIDAGEISQVIELACGLSPRGWRFRTRYGRALTYVEADLAGMIRRKRGILARLGGETADHYLLELDALADGGSSSLEALCARLDPARGTAILTEGLVNYFDRGTVEAMWERFSRALGRFSHGLYLTDIVLGDAGGPLVDAFRVLLGALVRGRLHLHYADASAVEAALHGAGFDAIALDPRAFALELPELELAGAGRVKIVEAKPRR
jgi:O-methyltransferase involved in polyketide biosynthesis